MSADKNIRAEWDQLIEKKLKDGKTVKDLYQQYPEEISMPPNTTKEDIAEEIPALSFHNRWTNMAVVKGEDAATINSICLQALNQGANALTIELPTEVNVQDALKGIMTEYLDVRILSENALKDLPKNTRQIGTGGTKEYHVQKDNKAAQYKKLLSILDKKQSIDIVVSVGKNLLYEISALRALRRILQEGGCSDFRIIGRYDIEGSNELGDYNLIEKTYKSISIVLGGADAVLTYYDGSEDARLTLNIQNILDLESGFSDVFDPVYGAYYVEKLTQEIIDRAMS